MAYLKSEELQAFKALARMLYFSNDTIKHFLENATAGQITAVGDQIRAFRARRAQDRAAYAQGKVPADKNL